eukprot:NODE_3082_length_1054_cov_6.543284_g2830_i0.p1 GENE.NODE_3082_length_1054_cov_6.543284_g2830_i0~~NODE_3082_length_1054_cov_6.543284_g2830_i0.p1  ORF type:complete len:279 (-),score=80.33 NODE_3082_length_1054_cov_6.543284_g2830_i0:115-951(-)
MFFCCKAIGEGCQGCGKACGFACDGFGECMCPKDRPSPLLVIWTFFMNSVIIAISVRNFFREFVCSRLKFWLAITVLTSIVHILFTFYLNKKMTKKLQETGKLQILDLMLYDVGVYGYLWLLLFSIIWLCMGPSWALDPAECLIPDMEAIVSLTVGYWVGALIIVCITICCDCFKSASQWKHNGQKTTDLNTAFISPAMQPAHPQPGVSFMHPQQQQQQQQQHQQQHQQQYQPLPQQYPPHQHQHQYQQFPPQQQPFQSPPAAFNPEFAQGNPTKMVS